MAKLGPESLNIEEAEKVAQGIVDRELGKALKTIREDFIIIFGIFASILIFLGIEIQIMKQAQRFSLLVGFSLFLLASLQIFLLGIQSMLREQLEVKNLKNNYIFWFVCLCYAASVFCFFWAAVLHRT